MSRIEKFRNKVKVKAIMSQEQIDLLSRDMWHCTKCGHDLHVSKFHFRENGELRNTCKYCVNRKRSNKETYEREISKKETC